MMSTLALTHCRRSRILSCASATKASCSPAYRRLQARVRCPRCSNAITEKGKRDVKQARLHVNGRAKEAGRQARAVIGEGRRGGSVQSNLGTVRAFQIDRCAPHEWVHPCRDPCQASRGHGRGLGDARQSTSSSVCSTAAKAVSCGDNRAAQTRTRKTVMEARRHPMAVVQWQRRPYRIRCPG